MRHRHAGWRSYPWDACRHPDLALSRLARWLLFLCLDGFLFRRLWGLFSGGPRPLCRRFRLYPRKHRRGNAFKCRRFINNLRWSDVCRRRFDSSGRLRLLRWHVFGRLNLGHYLGRIGRCLLWRILHGRSSRHGGDARRGDDTGLGDLGGQLFGALSTLLWFRRTRLLRRPRGPWRPRCFPHYRSEFSGYGCNFFFVARRAPQHITCFLDALGTDSGPAFEALPDCHLAWMPFTIQNCPSLGKLERSIEHPSVDASLSTNNYIVFAEPLL